MAKSLRNDSLTSRRIVKAFFDLLNSDTERPEPNLLVNIFRSQESITETGVQASHIEGTHDRPSSENHAGGSSAMPKDEDGVRESDVSGVPKDELFGHFFDALEKIHFFRATHGGETLLIEQHEIERSGSKQLDRKRLAVALKLLASSSGGGFRGATLNALKGLVSQLQPERQAATASELVKYHMYINYDYMWAYTEEEANVLDLLGW